MAPTTPGTLILHGGALCDPFYAAIYRHAGTRKPRIAVFLSAGSSLKGAREGFFATYCPRFSSGGFEPVFVPVAVDAYEEVAHDESYVNLVKSCQAVFLGGGAQANHARSLLEDDGGCTPLAGAIRDVYERGGVVAGNSAGTHVISNPMYSDGSSYEVLRANGLEPRRISDVPANADPVVPRNSISLPGLGLVSEDILLCTHHDARGRLGRLIAGVRDLGARYGVGVDEETSLVLKDGAKGPVGEVAGYCGTFIVEVTAGTSYAPAGKASSFAVSNLRLHYITGGDRFDFATGRVLPGPDKRKVGAESRSSAGAFTTDDIFSRGDAKYRATRTILTLVNSQAGHADTVASQPEESGVDDPVFQVTFSKDERTAAYTSDKPYSESRSAHHLEGLTKAAVWSLRVDVRELVRRPT